MHYTGGIYFITDGKIKFDTQVAGKLWQAWGFGLMYAANVFAPARRRSTFTTNVGGIENLGRHRHRFTLRAETHDRHRVRRADLEIS